MANEFDNVFVNFGKNTIQKSTPWLSSSSVKHTLAHLSPGSIPCLNNYFLMLM